jgi:predicted Zn-dependent protease
LRWEDTIQEASKAIDIDPSLPIGYIVLGPTLERVGKFQDAERILKQGHSIDPLSPDFGTVTLLMALDRGDDRLVEAIARQLIGSSREVGMWAHFLLARIAHDKGDHAAAEKEFRAFMAARGANEDITEPVSEALSSKASVAAAIKALRAEEAKDPTFEIAEFLGLIDSNGAWIDELNARIAKGETLSVAWRIGGVWRLLAQGEGRNPKVRALMRNAGLVDYWKANGWPDRCRPKGEDDFECS